MKKKNRINSNAFSQVHLPLTMSLPEKRLFFQWVRFNVESIIGNGFLKGEVSRDHAKKTWRRWWVGGPELNNEPKCYGLNGGKALIQEYRKFRGNPLVWERKIIG